MHYLTHLNIGLVREDYSLISKSNLAGKNDMNVEDLDKVNESKNASKSTIDDSIYSDDN